MDQNYIKEKLSVFFQNNILYCESMDEINADDSLINNGYIDSIGIIGLVSYIEKTFRFKVYDNEILPENFDSVNKIYNYISSKISS
ncbi:MAG TPA: acyl carrier protein [Clostridia bacterium]|nr:acyl carrier protein [Clostridia bacterium]